VGGCNTNRGKEFLDASWWYFVGPPPAEGGRRPRAEAAASPRRGLAAAKTSLLIQKVFDCKWYYAPPKPKRPMLTLVVRFIQTLIFQLKN
jgi:hypothetical protein